MTLSTHVLDLDSGRPAIGVDVALYRCTGEHREPIANAQTNEDGRIDAPFGGRLGSGEYELRFDAGEYFERKQIATFYGRISVRFRIEDEQHVHVPLLLSPWGYSTYRGS